MARGDVREGAPERVAHLGPQQHRFAPMRDHGQEHQGIRNVQSPITHNHEGRPSSPMVRSVCSQIRPRNLRMSTP